MKKLWLATFVTAEDADAYNDDGPYEVVDWATHFYPSVYERPADALADFLADRVIEINEYLDDTGDVMDKVTADNFKWERRSEAPNVWLLIDKRATGDEPNLEGAAYIVPAKINKAKKSKRRK